MTIPIEIKEKLEAKLGKRIRLSGDCSILALDIEQVTHEHIGINTLKRLLGFIPDEREPRATTLNIIANYMGYESWDALIKTESPSNSDFKEATEGIDVSQLALGEKVQIEYFPNRRVVMEYQGNFLFRVIHSENSKLHVNDILEVHHIISSYPLIVSEVIRAGKSLGLFTAGQTSGLSSVSII